MTLLYLGLLVILGFAAAKLCKRVGLPSVTGYMLVGLALGPSVFKIVGPDTLHALKPLSAFCLALIFFLLGEEFKLDELRKLGPRFLMMTVIQSVVTFAVVTGVGGGGRSDGDQQGRQGDDGGETAVAEWSHRHTPTRHQAELGKTHT